MGRSVSGGLFLVVMGTVVISQVFMGGALSRLGIAP